MDFSRHFRLIEMCSIGNESSAIYACGLPDFCAAINENELLSLDFLAGFNMQSVAKATLCTILGGYKGNTFGASVDMDLLREYGFQNRHAPLYLTCTTPCEAQHQRGLLRVLADIGGDWNYFQTQLFCPSC